MNKIVALFAALVMVVAGFTFSTSATAAEKCVPSPASTETIVHEAVTHQELDTPGSPAVDPVAAVPGVPAQHYSLKGNADIGDEETPVFPNDYWQPNAKKEPHSSTSVTWIGTVGAGLHYTSNESSGKRDWFYFAPAVAGSPFVPGKPAVEPTFKTVTDKAGFTETIRHPAVTCDDSGTPDSPDNPNSTDEPKTVIKVTPVEPKAKVQKSVQVPTEIESGL